MLHEAKISSGKNHVCNVAVAETKSKILGEELPKRKRVSVRNATSITLKFVIIPALQRRPVLYMTHKAP